jgi:hypothetical protein
MPSRSDPISAWKRFLLGHAAMGGGLGLIGGAVLLASPALGIVPLMQDVDTALTAASLVLLAFGGLTAAAFLATAMAATADRAGPGSRGQPQPLPVRVATRQVRRI